MKRSLKKNESEVKIKETLGMLTKPQIDYTVYLVNKEKA